MKKLLFVVNPVAGRRIIRTVLLRVLNVFVENGYLPTVYVSQSRGDSAAYIAAHAAEYDLVVCSGGDGSLNEAVSGLIQSGTDVPLGYIPAGSTNVFAESRRMPLKPVAAAADIVYGTPRRFDIGMFGERCFCYVAAFGLFSDLSYVTPQNRKNVLGPGAYFLDAFTSLANARPSHITITGTGYFPSPRRSDPPFSVERTGVLADGDYIFGVINNSDSVGSQFYVPDPLVSYDDGFFEVILIRRPDTTLDMQNLLQNLRDREFFSSPEIEIFRVRSLHLSSSPELSWALDGELATGMPEVDVTVLPQRLPLITK